MTATHPEYAALLGAVLDDPADDTARLVMADWLQENGDGERAEFIRVQCEMAYTPTCCRRKARRPCFQDGRCRWCSLAIRRNQLMWLSPGGGPPLWKTWCEGVDPSWVDLDTDNDDWRFGLHRGFLAGLRLPVASWLAHGAEILARHPVEVIRLPRFRAEIKPPEPGFGWQIHYYDNGPEVNRLAVDPPMFTRGEMVKRLIKGVRDLEGELA